MKKLLIALIVSFAVVLSIDIGQTLFNNGYLFIGSLTEYPGVIFIFFLIARWI